MKESALPCEYIFGVWFFHPEMDKVDVVEE
jgi:hypothetical protein